MESHFRDKAHRAAEVLLGAQVSGLSDAMVTEGPGRGRKQAWLAIKSCGGSLAVSPFYLGLTGLMTIGFLLAD